MEQDKGPTCIYPRQDVLMTRAISLRSRVHRKMQARFWRPVERGDPSAEFNGQKSPHFQLSLYQWQTARATTGPADWVVPKQRPSSPAGHGTAGTPSRVLVVGNGRRPPVVDAAGGRHALPLRLQTRRGGGNAARVFRAAAP